MSSIPRIKAGSITEDVLKRLLFQHGVVIIEDLIDCKKIDYFREELVPFVEKYWAQNAEPDSAEMDMRRQFQITDDMVRKATNPRSSLFDLLADTDLVATLEDVVGDSLSHSPYAHTRRVKPCGLRYDGASHLGYHYDAWYHLTNLSGEIFDLNCWCPFVDCGPKYRTPTLQFICQPLKVSMRALSNSSGQRIVDPAKMEEKDWNDQFGERQVAVLKKGDIALFTSWTIHGTYSDRFCESPRISAEIRFSSSGKAFHKFRGTSSAARFYGRVRAWLATILRGKRPL